MNCEKSKEYMLKYIEENLSESEMLELGEHIEKCEDCKEEFDAYCQIYKDIDNLEIPKFEDDIFSDVFESDIMKKISGIEFKTEKILILIIGLISISIALIMFVGMFNANVFNDEKVIKEIMKDSTGFIDNVIFSIDFIIKSVFRFISKFSIMIKPFSFLVLISFAVGKIIFYYLNVGEKNA